VLLRAPAFWLTVELLRLQVRGGRQAPRRLPLHRPAGRAEEDVPGPRALVPGGGLAGRLQQRDPALLDEAERERHGAGALAGASLRGHLDRLITRSRLIDEQCGLADV